MLLLKEYFEALNSWSFLFFCVAFVWLLSPTGYTPPAITGHQMNGSGIRQKQNNLHEFKASQGV